MAEKIETELWKTGGSGRPPLFVIVMMFVLAAVVAVPIIVFVDGGSNRWERNHDQMQECLDQGWYPIVRPSGWFTGECVINPYYGEVPNELNR